MGQVRWIENLNDPTLVGPMYYADKFQAGATQEIAGGDLGGEILERTADTNTRWVPADSDHDATAGAGLAISCDPVTSGDLAGVRRIIVPRPGDVFEADYDEADAIEPETALYWVSSTKLKKTAGTNIIAYSVRGPNAPALQKRLSQGQLGDSTETYRSTNRVRFVFRAACSFHKTIQKA